MKKSPLRRKKGLRKVSAKQKGRLAEYYRKRDEYMAEHPLCEVCLELNKSLHPDMLAYPAVDLHHRRGRGKYLCDERYFCATCRHHHDLIHRHGDWARKNGWLISKFQKD